MSDSESPPRRRKSKSEDTKSPPHRPQTQSRRDDYKHTHHRDRNTSRDRKTRHFTHRRDSKDNKNQKYPRDSRSRDRRSRSSDSRSRDHSSQSNDCRSRNRSRRSSDSRNRKGDHSRERTRDHHFDQRQQQEHKRYRLDSSTHSTSSPVIDGPSRFQKSRTEESFPWDQTQWSRAHHLTSEQFAQDILAEQQQYNPHFEFGALANDEDTMLLRAAQAQVQAFPGQTFQAFSM